MQQLISKSGSVHATLTRLLSVVFAVVLVSCGGGSGSGNNPPYTVGGTISGLASGNSVELDLLVAGTHAAFDNVDKDGLFRFAERLGTNDVYEVRVSTQPSGQTCTVENGAGTINISNVSNIVVTCANPRLSFVYATNENAATVATYAIDSTTGALSVVGSPVSTGTGTFPAPKGVAVDPSGKFAYVTNEGDNTIVTYQINSATGALTVVASISTPAGSGPLGVVVDPAGKFVYIAETGGKQIASYSINSATGALTYVNASIPAGEMYNLAMNPSGNYVYALEGFNGSVNSFGINRTTGAFTLLDNWNSSPAMSFNGIAVEPNGKYAYIAVGDGGSPDGGVFTFSINASTGVLTQQGSLNATNGEAQALVVDPTGKFLYVTSNNTVIAYVINSTTGALTTIGSPLNLGVNSSPRGITVDRGGKFVYVANSGTNTIAAFAINVSTGALTSIGTTATGSNTQPQAITSY